MKNILLIFLVSIMALFFTSCQNGVSFEPSEVANHETNTEIPDGDGGSSEDDNDIEIPDGTGIHSFKLDITNTSSNSSQTNFDFRKFETNNAAITDTTGKGFTVTFNLTIDVPDVLEATLPVTEGGEGQEGENLVTESQQRLGTSGETLPPVIDTPVVDIPLEDGDQNITVTIATYEKKEGEDTFPTAYFTNSEDTSSTELKEFTFTPDKDTIELTVIYPDILDVQRGIIPITFDTSGKFKAVYKDTMPRELSLSVYSKGTAVKTRVTPGVLTEQTDDPIIEIFNSDTEYNLRIKGESLVDAEKDKTIPLSISLDGVREEYPVRITAKESSNLTVSDTPLSNGEIKFTATHSGVKKMQKAKGKVTLVIAVIDKEHNKFYIGLPYEIVINTERDETFKYYIDGYRDNFTVSEDIKTSDNGYYTNVTIKGMDILGATAEDKVTYEIFRKDDSSPDFKLIRTATAPANQKFPYKDRNALILRTPKQEYKIKITHATCTNDEKCSSVFETAPTQKGSRLLTNREFFLAAMDSIRYALIDKGIHNKDDFHTAGGGTFTEDYWYNPNITYTHKYTVNGYKPNFITLKDGSFQYTSEPGDSGSIDTDGSISSRGAPFSGTVNFKSDYGNGSITFNNIDINENDWWQTENSWARGNFTLTMDGKEPITYGKDDVPFGLYMSKDRFVEVLLDKEGNYTQK